MKAADAFKNPHDTRCLTPGPDPITTTGILIHQEGPLRCEALTIGGTIHWIVAFHEDHSMTNMLYADVTSALDSDSDSEINNAALLLFNRLKTEYASPRSSEQNLENN